MSPDALGSLLPILLVVLLLFVMVIRPARKRAQHVSKLQAALSPGDDVMLTSGIYASVSSIEGDKIRVTVADGVVVTVHRGAIAEIVRDVPADAAHDGSESATPSTPSTPAMPSTPSTRADTDGSDDDGSSTPDSTRRGAS